MILSARFVRKSKKMALTCNHCSWLVVGPHIRLYGAPEPDEKPYTIRLHIECVEKGIDVSQESKIEKALEKAKEYGYD